MHVLIGLRIIALAVAILIIGCTNTTDRDGDTDALTPDSHPPSSHNTVEITLPAIQPVDPAYSKQISQFLKMDDDRIVAVQRHVSTSQPRDALAEKNRVTLTLHTIDPQSGISKRAPLEFKGQQVLDIVRVGEHFRAISLHFYFLRDSVVHFDVEQIEFNQQLEIVSNLVLKDQVYSPQMFHEGEIISYQDSKTIRKELDFAFLYEMELGGSQGRVRQYSSTAGSFSILNRLDGILFNLEDQQSLAIRPGDSKSDTTDIVEPNARACSGTLEGQPVWVVQGNPRELAPFYRMLNEPFVDGPSDQKRVLAYRKGNSGLLKTAEINEPTLPYITTCFGRGNELLLTGATADDTGPKSDQNNLWLGHWSNGHFLQSTYSLPRRARVTNIESIEDDSHDLVLLGEFNFWQVPTHSYGYGDGLTLRVDSQLNEIQRITIKGMSRATKTFAHRSIDNGRHMFVGGTTNAPHNHDTNRGSAGFIELINLEEGSSKNITLN